MKDLKELRVEIDEIDAQIARLFEKRMEVAKGVVEYKIANNLEIFQPERENEVLIKNCERIKNEELKPQAKQFFQTLMDISKQYQSRFLNKN